MAQPQLMQVKLSRFDAQPWGFRLQGGVDFAAPLLVQKVNGGSLAEKAGLIPGDAVLKINDIDVFNLRHKDAQDIVVRSGNNFVITIQRGGSTWRPHVTPTGHIPQPNQPNSPYLQTVTKTSLSHKQQDSQHIGCGYNNAPRPFANGGDASVKSIVNKQYNTPVGIYSDESIAETLSAQAEVLAGGVLGVNFKKNEKEYQGDKSEVLKFLREEETGQSTPEPHSPANFYWTQSHAIGGNERHTPLSHQRQQEQNERVSTSTQQNTLAPGASHRPSVPQVAKAAAPASKPITQISDATPAPAPEAADPRVIMLPVCPALQGPEYKAEMEAATAALQNDEGPRPLSASGHPACALCGVGIVGVFVRIKDKNLHVECFKCATCGTSLKNQGYYNFNNKLYCDIHAKLAAMQNPPSGTEGYVPVPIKPNTKLSANTVSSALSAHGFNGVPVANGSSTPTSAPHEDGTDLPLPPPPSPTQLQHIESESLRDCGNSTSSHQSCDQTRTNSSLSSLSSTGSSCTSSISTASAPTVGYGLENCGDGCGGSISRTGDGVESVALSLDAFATPMHSRHQATCSSLLGQGGDSFGANLPPPPPPPPPPMTNASEADLYISPKNHLNNSNTRVLQQHVARKQQLLMQQQQNENDMNTQNQNVAGAATGANDAKQQLSQSQPAHNVYNKFLKEYSNKLLTQNHNNNNNKTIDNTPNIKDFKLFNETAKPHQSSSVNVASAATTTATNPNVATVAATIANQLKFNPCQVASSAASSATIINPDAAALDNTNNNTNNLESSQITEPAMLTEATSAQSDQTFSEYVTLTGNVIRSVVPPGKGANINYKVNQRYARPYGATSGPPAAAPKSPVSYPPQPQQWGAPQRPAGNPYATLPRTNVGQQGRRSANTYSNYGNNYTAQYRAPTVAAARTNKYATMPSYNSSQYNNYSNRELCTKTTYANSPLPHKSQTEDAGQSTKTKDDVDVASHRPPTDSQSGDPTALLAQSLGKINMGDKMENFMAEAGKILSNMLEARLANNNSLQQLPSQGPGTQSVGPNSSRGPMSMRNRFELEDVKSVDPTEPMALNPVDVIPLGSGSRKTQPPTALSFDLPAHHPVGKLLASAPDSAKVNQRRSPSPVSLVDDNANKHIESSSLPRPQTAVVYRNKSEGANGRPNRGGELSTHAIDRRSYIESGSQSDNVMDGPAFSIHVRGLGKSNETNGEDAALSPEDEAVVSQLLKDGKRPICCQCNAEITKGPFITALGRIWCPDHFICVNGNCRRPLQDIGFVEEKGDLYCEYCFEKYLAPVCSKCGGKIKGDCLNAIGKQFHPECFNCGHCGKLFGNTPFFLEDGNAYCEADWNELFTTKCFACGFPVEAGDRWVEALNNNYHSQCFNCTYCKQNLEGQSFYNKGGRPFCKNHAR